MTYTAKELSEQFDIKPQSVVTKLGRMGHKFGVNDPIPEVILVEALKDYAVHNSKPKRDIAKGLLKVLSPAQVLNGSNVSVQPKELPEQQKAKPEIRMSERNKILTVLPYLPLPMLGLAASYGVYFFSLQFVPLPVAIAEAMAFELTYIGLATLTDLSNEERRKAKSISIGAVFVSVIYNTLAGALHLNTGLFLNLHPIWFWVLSVVHGAPLAVLAYLVSDLIFHKK